MNTRSCVLMKVSSILLTVKTLFPTLTASQRYISFKKNNYRMYNIQSALKSWTGCATVPGASCKHWCKKSSDVKIQWSRTQSCGFRKTLFVLVSATFWLTSSSVAALSRFFANFFFMLPIKLSYLKEKRRFELAQCKNIRIRGETRRISGFIHPDKRLASYLNVSHRTSEPFLHPWCQFASCWSLPLLPFLPLCHLDSSESSVSATKTIKTVKCSIFIFGGKSSH